MGGLTEGRPAVIEDRELRDLFRAESAEHLHNIEAGLLQLESNPAAVPLLDEVFREAHSLKGAARMLGLREVQAEAHGLETFLSEARLGRVLIDAAAIATQLKTLDAIRRLVARALGDVPAPAPSVTVPEPPPTAAPAISGPSPPNPPSSQPSPQSSLAPDGAAPVLVPPVPDFRIETLRIESGRLDALLQLSAELMVSKGRMARHQTDLAQLLTQCEHLLKQPETLAAGLSDLLGDLARLHGRMAGDGARFETVAMQLEGDIRQLRLLPMSTLLDLFPRMVHDLAAELGKQIDYRVEGATTVADKRIIEEMKAPLTHLLRNAIDHGIETPAERLQVGKAARGLIRVRVTQGADAVEIALSDDGRGLDLERIRQQAVKQRLHTALEVAELTKAQLHALILQPGFSTAPIITDLSGRGVGMAAVHAAVERLRGSLVVDSEPGRGVEVRLRVPVSLTGTRAMLLREWGQTYALPFDAIAFVRRLRPSDIHTLEGRQCFYQGDQAVPLERLGLLLERAAPALTDDGWLHCLGLRVDQETFALALDEVLETEDIVVKPTAAPLIRVRNVAGLAVLSSGLVAPVLNPHDLLRSLSRPARGDASVAAGEDGPGAPKRLLLVEDSITTRMQERRILEAAGYSVVTAVDGLDAWGKLALSEFDAVVSDIQMPRMSGLELALKIREHRRFAELPIVLVTSLANEADRRRGLEAGADAYITKSEFDQSLLLDCLARLA